MHRPTPASFSRRTFSRPAAIAGAWTWKPWSGRRPGSPVMPDAPLPSATDAVIEPAIADYDLNARLAALTPVGLPEQLLLHAINNGNLRSLQDFPGIGPKVSVHILAFREQHRFLASLDELVRVPLIGKVRFRQLVGRESTVLTHPVHAWLRLPLDQPVRRSDLRERTWVAPGLPRLHWAADEFEEAAERARAIQAGWTLVVRRVGTSRLCFHGTRPQWDGWAALLVAQLPACLRRLSAPADSTPAPAP